MNKKRGQAWGFDLIIGSILFAIGVIGFYFFAINSQQEQYDKLEELNYAATSLADTLLSEGLPNEWDSDNVVRIGITSNSKINQTKLERLYNLSLQNYEITKNKFNIIKEYYIIFKDPFKINDIDISSIGKNPQNQNNMIKQTRLSVYKDRPITIEVYIWD